MNKEMRACIAPSKSGEVENKFKPQENISHYDKMLDIHGNETTEISDAVVKVFSVGNRIVYSVYATTDGFIYDPWGFYSEMEHKKRYPRLKWVNITEAAYNHYVSFLKSKNKLFLSYVNRGLTANG